MKILKLIDFIILTHPWNSTFTILLISFTQENSLARINSYLLLSESHFYSVFKKQAS